MEQGKPKKTLMERIKAAGPAAIITSAFIGPGTITTSTNAGVNFGYALLWAVVFSGISLVIIMNMASRIAIVGNKNIMDAATDLMPHSKVWKWLVLGMMTLVVVLTGFGFEAGNLIGATTGLNDIIGIGNWASALIMGGISLAFIIFSTPTIVEQIMKGFVALMGIVFFVTALLVRPDIMEILRGLIPIIPDGAMVTTIALIGTTIIGINLVFHSIASEEKWADGNEDGNLEDAYFDTGLNISLGVIMTLGVIIATAATLFGTGTVVDSPIVYAASLEPTLGVGARIFAALGLILAGLSSATATPYMVGHIVGRIFKWNKPNDVRRKIVGSIVVIFGMLFAMYGTTPVPIILFAQATSGVFLPFIAILFVVAANNKSLGIYKNNAMQNLLGFGVVIVMFFLGGRTLWNVFSNFF